MTTKPSPPLPHNERAFIEWLLRYGRDFELVRMIYASNLDRAVQLFANQADKELREYNSHETLRARSDYIHRLFAEGFFPAISNDIRNILFLEPTRQAEYMQIFVKMALLDYILLYKYKDKLLVAKETVEGLGLEKLYEPNQAEQSPQVTEESREHERIPFSPSLPDVTKTKPIKAYSAGPYILFLSQDVAPIGGGDFIQYKFVMALIDGRDKYPRCFVTLENSPIASNVLCVFEANGSHSNFGSLAGPDLMQEFVVKSMALLRERFNLVKIDEIAAQPEQRSRWKLW